HGDSRTTFASRRSATSCRGISVFLRFLRSVHLPEPVDDPQIVLTLSSCSEKLEPANSAGGKVMKKMDVLIDNGLANGGWLFERVNGLFNGLGGDLERISPPVDVVEDH